MTKLPADMSDTSNVVSNPWQDLRQFTQARIALGRSGVSLPTSAQLEFQLAHACARDAVYHALDTATLAQALNQAGHDCQLVHSACLDRSIYLQRPDLGRKLNADSRLRLGQLPLHPCDLALVIADGLSAFAIEQNVLPFLSQLRGPLEQDGWSLTPIVIVQQGRVAIGDEIGELMGARAVVVLIGERPGLSSPDSMGLYFTWAPRVGLTDADRNCISNVRPAGLSYEVSARRLSYLLAEARRRGISGVDLKDETVSPANVGGHQVRNFLLG
jgi:ethanolamine ammonia-lyase small subunit